MMIFRFSITTAVNGRHNRERKKMGGIDYTSIIVVVVIAAGVVGWGVIEGILWVAGSISISFI